MKSDASADPGTRVDDFVFEEETNGKKAAVKEVTRNTEVVGTNNSS